MQEELLNNNAERGRILHFVLDKGYSLQCRPAMVVEDWPESGRPGYVNLVVFIDGSNDNRNYEADGRMPLVWQTSVLPNHAVKVYRTWHWPRECKSLHPAAEPFTVTNKGRFHHTHQGGIRDVPNCYACLLIDSSKETVDA